MTTFTQKITLNIVDLKGTKQVNILFSKNLSGHSGCDVSLFTKECGESFVRKTSASIEYNTRLKNQCKKQKTFTSNEILVPTVIKEGITKEGLFYFDMEFIRGSSLQECFLKNRLDNLIDPIRKIERFLFEKKSNRKDISFEIKEKCSILSLTIDKKYKKYFDYIESINWKDTTVDKFCHGDLTFENIIVSENKVYFIDFLDSFVNTSLLDCAKIQQDLLYFWSWRNYNRKPIIKNLFFLDRLGLFSGFEKNTKKINGLMILNMLRIIPYTEKESLKNYIDNCLELAVRRKIYE